VRSVDRHGSRRFLSVRARSLQPPDHDRDDGDDLPSNLSLFRAAGFAPLGSFSTGTGTAPFGVCSDGISFWISLPGSGKVVKF
jgi:hypothetical protein